MRLSPGTYGMTAMLAMLTALGPLSTDLYLPSLPGMTVALGADLARVQLTLSVFLGAFALSQVVYGPVSDKLGRRPVILAGLGLYCVASVVCAFAPTIEMLIAGRALQAVGAAAPIVLGRAIVRDVYEGPMAARELSRMGMIMGVVPAVAPLIGGLLDPIFGWRAAFLFLVLAGGSLALAAALLLPETIRDRQAGPVSFASSFASFGIILANPVFRRNTAASALCFAGLFGFISGSSFVLQQAYGLSQLEFAMSFGAMCLGFVAGAVTTQRIVGAWGLARTLRAGGFCVAAGGFLMLLLAVSGLSSPVSLTLVMAVYAAGVGLVLPSANAGAMMPFPERAGAASSLQGLVQGGFAAGTAAITAQWLDGRPLLLPAVIAAAGLAAAAVILWRRRDAPAM
jgi:MFS transporter, DHA1 family, multidrug resistance protein